MTRRRPRRLTAEEEELWRKVQRATDPLHASRSGDKDRADTPANDRPLEKPDRRDPIPPFEIGASRQETAPAHDLSPSINDALRRDELRMDRKRFTKMKRGKLTPEARLDLHGMTLDRAHGALNRFILQGHSLGYRLVLVITGKGKDRDEGGPIPTRMGVLRHQVPQWLRLPPLSHAVLQVSEAHLRHGGGGAFYVYLRRKR